MLLDDRRRKMRPAMAERFAQGNAFGVERVGDASIAGSTLSPSSS
jgi:hypothetical protein